MQRFSARVNVITHSDFPPPASIPAPGTSLYLTGALYKLTGSSQAFIGRGSDGALYVIKYHGFPGPYGLMNEVIGVELIRKLGLPCPEWQPIHVPAEFLDRHPDLWFQNGKIAIRPSGELHFASRLILSEGDSPTYQIVPRSWWRRVENRADLVAMTVLDLWMNSCDRRQAVFVSADRTKNLRAVFIDNDHILGGRFGGEQTCARLVLRRDLEAYRDVWSLPAAEHWKNVIENIDERWLAAMLTRVPREWATPSMLAHSLEQLRIRRPRLGALIREADTVLSTGHSAESTRPVCATRPDFLRYA